MDRKQDLDPLDYKILEILVSDANLPFTEIGNRLEVSGGTVHVRMKKMQALGIVKGSQLLIVCVCLIFAGAVGNLIDSVFYGLVFSSSYGQVASLFPESGYAPLFYGSVVDMIQFPLATWNWPSWVPFIGGDQYTFFEYVFNFADSYISTGVILLLIFNKKVSL